MITFAEFEQLPDPVVGRYELRLGHVLLIPPAKHYILRVLLETAAGREFVVCEKLTFRSGDHDYRVVDVGVLPRARFFGFPKDSYRDFAPELVAEVLSPSSTPSEILEKEQLCLESGATEFWVVDPERCHVRVTTRDGRTNTYKPGGTIPLYFGGSIAIDDIFRN